MTDPFICIFGWILLIELSGSICLSFCIKPSCKANKNIATLGWIIIFLIVIGIIIQSLLFKETFNELKLRKQIVMHNSNFKI